MSSFDLLGTYAAIGANDRLEDVVGFGSPDEWFGVLIMHGDVILDRGDQLGHAAKDAAFQSVRRDTAEKAFEHVESGSGCRREIDMEARMFFQPLLDLRMLVSRVVVAVMNSSSISEAPH